MHLGDHRQRVRIRFFGFGRHHRVAPDLGFVLAQCHRRKPGRAVGARRQRFVARCGRSRRGEVGRNRRHRVRRWWGGAPTAQGSERKEGGSEQFQGEPRNVLEEEPPGVPEGTSGCTSPVSRKRVCRGQGAASPRNPPARAGGFSLDNRASVVLFARQRGGVGDPLQDGEWGLIRRVSAAHSGPPAKAGARPGGRARAGLPAKAAYRVKGPTQRVSPSPNARWRQGLYRDRKGIGTGYGRARWPRGRGQRANTKGAKAHR